MFFVMSLNRTLVINPRFLGPQLEPTLKRRLKELVEGTVNPRFGFIICVLSIEELGDGLVKDGTGDVLFDIKYQAVVFKPFKGEVLDGVVTEVKENVVHVNVGPLRGAIANSNMPPGYRFAPQENVYLCDGRNEKIGVGSEIRFQLLGVTIKTGSFFFVGIINDRAVWKL